MGGIMIPVIIFMGVDVTDAELKVFIQNELHGSSYLFNKMQPYAYVNKPIEFYFYRFLNNDSYVSTFLGCIAAVDGVVLTLGISLSLERLSQIKNFYQNSMTITKIINTDILLKVYPWFVVVHLFITLCLFIMIATLRPIVFLLLLSSLFAMICYMFAYFKRIEEYASFASLNIKNKKLQRLTKTALENLDDFIRYLSLLKTLIISFSNYDERDKRVKKYIDEILIKYIMIFRKLRKEKYQNIFISNGEFRNNYNFIIPTIGILYDIYEDALNKNKIYIKVYITDTITKTAIIAGKSKFVFDYFYQKAEIYNILNYIEAVTLANAETYNKTVSVGRKVLLQYGYKPYFDLLQNDNLPVCQNELLSTLFNIVRAAIDNKQLDFISNLVKHQRSIYERKNYHFSHLLMTKMIQYSLYIQDYSILEICFKFEKINLNCKSCISPFPYSTKDYCCLLMYDCDYFISYDILNNRELASNLWNEVILVFIVKDILFYQHNPQIQLRVKQFRNDLKKTLNTLEFVELEKLKEKMILLKDTILKKLLNDTIFLSYLYLNNKILPQSITEDTIRKKLNLIIFVITHMINQRLALLNLKTLESKLKNYNFDSNIILNKKNINMPDVNNRVTNIFRILKNLGLIKYKTYKKTSLSVITCQISKIDILRKGNCAILDIWDILCYDRNKKIWNVLLQAITKVKKDSIKIADLNLAIKEQFQDYILISTLSYNTLNNLRTSLLRVKPIYDDKPFLGHYILENGLSVCYIHSFHDRLKQFGEAFLIRKKDFNIIINNNNFVETKENGADVSISILEKIIVNISSKVKIYSIKTDDCWENGEYSISTM